MGQNNLRVNTEDRNFHAVIYHESNCHDDQYCFDIIRADGDGEVIEMVHKYKSLKLFKRDTQYSQY